MGEESGVVQGLSRERLTNIKTFGRGSTIPSSVRCDGLGTVNVQTNPEISKREKKTRQREGHAQSRTLPLQLLRPLPPRLPNQLPDRMLRRFPNSRSSDRNRPILPAHQRLLGLVRQRGPAPADGRRQSGSEVEQRLTEAGRVRAKGDVEDGGECKGQEEDSTGEPW